MIYELSRYLDQRLAAQEFPCNVVYGPDRFERQNFRTVVVLERDRQRGDSFEGPQGQQRNTRRLGQRQVGCLATIFAQSPKMGARVNEHEHLADQIVDALHCALINWRTATRSSVTFTGGRFAGPNDLPGNFESLPGVVYLLQFSVARGVEDRKFDGSGLGTAILTDVNNEATNVRRTPSDENPSVV